MPVDGQDFVRFYAATSAWIRRRIRPLCGGDSDLVEDMVQEAYIRAIRGWHTYRGDRGSERSWLFGIARNCVRGYLARKRAALHPEAIDALIDERPAVAERVLSGELGEALLRLLYALPAEEQVLVRAVLVDGRRLPSVAAEAGMSLRSARLCYRRAVATLRASLRSEGLAP